MTWAALEALVLEAAHLRLLLEATLVLLHAHVGLLMHLVLAAHLAAAHLLAHVAAHLASHVTAHVGSAVAHVVLAVVVGARGHVDAELAAVEVVAVHLLDDHGQDGLVLELDKAEALGPAGLLVGDDLDRVDVAKVGKGVADLLLGGAPGDVADVDRVGGVGLLIHGWVFFVVGVSGSSVKFLFPTVF